jgi:hypothetical protein
VAYFGRAGDPAGMNHWIDDINVNHFTIEQVGDTFALQSEAKDLYSYLALPNLGSPTLFVTAIYNNLFERDPDAAGLQYWVERLTGNNYGTNPNGEHISAGTMIAAIINGAYAGTGPNHAHDVASMTNKITVADYFTDQLIANNITWDPATMRDDAAACIDNVTWDPATITTGEHTADASVDAFVATSGQTFTLTTTMDHIVGTAGNDTILGSIDGAPGGVTTYNPGDIIDGGAGTNTLQITNAHNTTVDVYGADATNIQNLVIRNYDQNLDAVNVNGGSFKSVTLDFVQTYNNTTVDVEGLSNTADFTVQNVRGSYDKGAEGDGGEKESVERNSNGTVDLSTGTVSTSNTIKNIDVSGAVSGTAESGTAESGTAKSGTYDDFSFYGNENFANASTINHTLNVQNVNGSDVGSNRGYGVEVEDSVTSNKAGSVINSTVNVSNVITNGTGDYNGEVYVYGDNNSGGTSTYNVTANIADSDNIDFYYEANKSGAADVITYNVSNVASTTGHNDSSELWSYGFETINLNVTGDSTFNYFGDGNDAKSTSDIVVNINAAANFTVSKTEGYTSNSYTEFDSTSGKVKLNISGAGNVALGETYLTDHNGTVDAHALTGNLSMELVNDFAAVTGGSGNDSFTLDAALAPGHIIDGGKGVDSLKFNNDVGPLSAQDYALINGVILNFEKLEFANALTLDTSKLTGTYSAFTFDNDSKVTSTVTNVNGQALTAYGNLDATAKGYDGTTTPHTYAGALNITAKGDASTITACADSAAVTVAAGTSDVGVTIKGDLKSALSINTVNAADSTTNPTVDTLASAVVTIDTTALDGLGLGALTALTLTGNGSVTVDNSNGGTATIDASGLGGTLAYGTSKGNKGDITGGLTFTANDNVAETIKLGSGQDVITDNGSTYGKMDTIYGFDAVQESAPGKSVVDILAFAGLTLNGLSANPGIEKITIDTSVYTTLALAFTHAAAVSNGKEVVQFSYGGDTYLFNDTNTNGLLDNTDQAIKLVGSVDLTTDFATPHV